MSRLESPVRPQVVSDASRRPVPEPREPESLFRVVWRWHFYAGVLVAPVLLVVAVTGALYVFNPELSDWLYADLYFVEPAAERRPLEEQHAVVRQAAGDLELEGLQLSTDPRRSTQFFAHIHEGGDGNPVQKHRVYYVDPYTGHMLGTRILEHGFFAIVLKIHRELFVGTTGRIVTELATSWTVILLATGLYLWWPRRREKVRGVWLPRLAGKPYVVLRDLHALAGMYLLPVALLIAVTGLFYTIVWGEGFHLVTREARPAEANAGTGDRAAAERAEPSQTHQTQQTAPMLTLDEVAGRARRRYPDRDLFVSLPRKPTEDFQVSAWTDFDRATYGPFRSAQFVLDRTSGAMLSHTTLSKDPRFWWHGWVYPLHVGSVLGLPTKLLWLLACLVLTALPVTGVWMWWKRRPQGQTGLPHRPAARWPWWLVCATVALCAALPLFAASVLLIASGEGCARLVRRRLATT